MQFGEHHRNSSTQSLNTAESFIESSKKSNIVLPNQDIDIRHVAVDIGGSLAKVVWFSKLEEGGRLNFRKFETAKIEQLIDFLQELLRERGDLVKLNVKATGGGAHKFYDLFLEKLNIQLQKEDEMECLITGLNFLVRQIENEVFTYDERRPLPMEYELSTAEIFPYMLVNIGSGVSIIKVTSNETYERISGTSLGGGTLWGLLGLLTDSKDYDSMLELSKKGDNRNVDMLVGDIYGGHYNKIGLKSSTIASSFGKVIKCPPETRKNSFKQEDISLSLLYLVSNNIGQIAYLNAKAHGIDRIYFSGFYISGHSITMNTLSYAISFWSQGKMQANFLRHEGYLGAIGAFLKDPPSNTKLSGFRENFSQIGETKSKLYALGFLDQTQEELKPFPLLENQSNYNPDTFPLIEYDVQKYWINLLDVNLKHLVEMATEKKGGEDRASKFEEMYRAHLSELLLNPNAYGPLTVRGLLKLREQCLREMGFNDVFAEVKRKENSESLSRLADFLKNLDGLEGHSLVQTLLDNVIAGNMYDWGSAVIQEMIERGKLSFMEAKATVGFNPSLNNSKVFTDRLVGGKPYKKCMVFVDNSGADIVFGILPFVRYLLSRGTIVVLAANTYPSVNDITSKELTNLLSEITDNVLSDAWKNGTLQVVATGSGAPCLSFLQISEATNLAAKDVDLLLIEGMGRAIHTNFYAKFNVDTVKIGSFKNPQIAKVLGAKIYDGLCLFEPVPI